MVSIIASTGAYAVAAKNFTPPPSAEAARVVAAPATDSVEAGKGNLPKALRGTIVAEDAATTRLRNARSAVQNSAEADQDAERTLARVQGRLPERRGDEEGDTPRRRSAGLSALQLELQRRASEAYRARARDVRSFTATQASAPLIAEHVAETILDAPEDTGLTGPASPVLREKLNVFL